MAGTGASTSTPSALSLVDHADGGEESNRRRIRRSGNDGEAAGGKRRRPTERAASYGSGRRSMICVRARYCRVVPVVFGGRKERGYRRCSADTNWIRK
mmetsp:Transcript_4557/g.9571  ORF Transcript_4557/g.9571 Transcript_4557/m.9571 type:complete len:98 (+) Transcript_4557:2296-2589(+)